MNRQAQAFLIVTVLIAIAVIAYLKTRPSASCDDPGCLDAWPPRPCRVIC
jgi:hypothetical protein